MPISFTISIPDKITRIIFSSLKPKGYKCELEWGMFGKSSGIGFTYEQAYEQALKNIRKEVSDV